MGKYGKRRDEKNLTMNETEQLLDGIVLQIKEKDKRIAELKQKVASLEAEIREMKRNGKKFLQGQKIS